MIVSTMNDLPGFQVTEVIGEVFGLTVCVGTLSPATLTVHGDRSDLRQDVSGP